MMKKYLILLLTVFALNSCEDDTTIIDDTADKRLPKVDVIHYDAKTDTWKTLNINGNALKAHLAHGDLEGSLEDRLTYVPDDAFERDLILFGYDDVMDDYVLTRNIIYKEFLGWPECCCSPPFIDYGCVNDMTGIEDFKNLKFFRSDAHNFKSLDFSGNLKLERLYLIENEQLVNLDLSKNEMLKSIAIEAPYGQLEILDLSNNPNLEDVYLDIRQLEILDLSNNPNLERIELYYWQLKELNLKNGNNNLITTYEVYGLDGSSFLTCVQVDDKIWSDNNWYIDELKYVFSEDCGY